MLKGKTALITGGTGALGAAMIEVFCREGCKVYFTYNSHAEKAQRMCAEFSESGYYAVPLALNVLDSSGAGKIAQEIDQESGLDILVNNAGVTQIMPFALLEESDWDMVMDVNVKGMFLVTKAFLRGMISRRKGCILNMGSLAGMRILEVPVHYATAKSAVLGFTLSLAKETARYGIRVNALVPGRIDGGVGENVPDRLREEYNKYCLAGRPGRPEEVAELAAFVCSDRASYINAQTIFVDGGI